MKHYHIILSLICVLIFTSYAGDVDYQELKSEFTNSEDRDAYSENLTIFQSVISDIRRGCEYPELLRWDLMRSHSKMLKLCKKIGAEHAKKQLYMEMAKLIDEGIISDSYFDEQSVSFYRYRDIDGINDALEELQGR